MKSIPSLLLCCGLFAAVSHPLCAVEPHSFVPIDTSGFRDGAHHWRKIKDDSRVIQAEPDQPVYEPVQVAEIAANVLLFQRSNGGWPKDYDMLAVLTEDQRMAVIATRDREDTSFDNHNIHAQVDYLTRAYQQHPDAEWQAACLRGFDFLLAAQLTNGGFPQKFPNAKGYSAHITFNDGVMIGILNVLQDAAEAQPQWQWLDEDRRSRARQAVDRGIECILRCQIRTGDLLTGWCQQHDASTLAAAPARTFELASICPQDTTEIVRFLMRQPKQEERISKSIESAVVWLRSVVIEGIRVERIPAPVVEFQRHRSDFDVVVRDDPDAKPIWARHFEIGTNRPIFSGRDAIKHYALREIERERRTGTPWYGHWPAKLLDVEYLKWQTVEDTGSTAR